MSSEYCLLLFDAHAPKTHDRVHRVKVVGEGNTYEILESLRGLGSTENLDLGFLGGWVGGGCRILGR